MSRSVRKSLNNAIDFARALDISRKKWVTGDIHFIVKFL